MYQLNIFIKNIHFIQTLGDVISLVHLKYLTDLNETVKIYNFFVCIIMISEEM